MSGRRESEDVEELRGVLNAVSDFLKDIREPIEGLLKMLMESVSGEKLAKEVSSFYRSLVESGIDQQTAKEWTERFLNERLKTLPSLGALKDLMSEWPKRAETRLKEKGEE
ncbi:MAG: hypothetical protein QXP80_03445 [Zestosphaera sp.]